MFEENLPKLPSIEATFKIVSLDLIDDPEKPIRTDLSPESVEDLVISIRQVGIIEPLVVRQKGERFEVIAGHRRLVASGIAGLIEAPCFIVKADDEKVEVLKIHENLYRQEISPSDQAEHFDYLIKQCKFSPAKIAQLIGKSHGFVFQRLAILNYHPQLKEALDSNKIKFSVAREFALMEDTQKMLEYLHYSIVNGITPALAKRWVLDWRRSVQQTTDNPNDAFNQDAETPIIESTSTCIYCQQAIKLSEANVVYIHNNCLKSIQTPPPPPLE